MPHLLPGQIRDPTNRRVVAVTFDAGADDAGAPKIFAALTRIEILGAALLSLSLVVAGRVNYEHREIDCMPTGGAAAGLAREQ